MRFMKFLHSAIHNKNKCMGICAKLAVYGSDSKACSSLNYIAHIYGFDKYRVFDQRLIRPTPVEASELEMSRAGAIRDFVLWRDELRHSIGNWVIPKSNLDEIIKYLCCE